MGRSKEPSATLLFAACLIAALLASTSVAQAAPINVNTVVDEYNANSAACSLREAIRSANTDSAAQSPGCVAGSGADEIVLRGGNYRSSIVGADDANAKGDLDITGTLTISAAPGADVALSNGVAGETVIQILAGSNVVLDGLTITGGDGVSGGGVNNAGTATLTNVAVKANHSGAFGGGIYNGGTMTVIDSTVANNNSNATGGGIYQALTGNLSVARSTIRDNFAPGFSGGVFASGPVQIDRSVITGNRSDGSGGGVYVGGTTAVTNSTIAGNEAGDGGGFATVGTGSLSLNNATVVRNSATSANSATPRGGGISQAGSSVVTVQDSIVALNTDAASSPGPDCKGNITSTGHTLLGSSQGCTYTAGSGDLLNLDPVLGPLADNGGPTKTVTPLAGSPAVDAGASTLSADQRGSPRPIDAIGVSNSANGSDIGAVEVAATPPAADTTPPNTTITKTKITQAKRKVTMGFLSSEPGSTFRCRLDKKPLKSCTPPTTFIQLKPGKHKLEVQATDAAGNTDSTPAHKKFKIKD